MPSIQRLSRGPPGVLRAGVDAGPLRLNRVRDSSALRAPRERHRYVAGPAEQPVVLQAAFAAAVGDRDDVIRFPPRTSGPPGPPRGAIGHRRFRAAPLTMRLDDVEAAEPAGTLVALLHLPPHVPRTAADLPLVNARLAAEGPPRRLHGRVAPPADRVAGRISLGLAPLIRGYDTLPTSTHRRRIGTSAAEVYLAAVIVISRQSPFSLTVFGTDLRMLPGSPTT
jgi:hypothetical protein